MSKVVWTAEDGWTDDGPEVDVTVDGGRVVSRHYQTSQGVAQYWRVGRLAQWNPTVVRRPLIAAAAVGGLIALASACSTPVPTKVAGGLVESCRHYATHATTTVTAGGNIAGVRLLSSGAAWVVLVGDEPAPCDADATSPADRIDVIQALVNYGGDVTAATVECNDAGGTVVGPVNDDDTELICRTVDY